jgi:prepilin-type N-terminal cleavage/methylation domain-containing protein
MCASAQRRRPAGFTLIECLFATAIVAVFFCAVYAISARCMWLVNQGREVSAAQFSLQDRFEQLRCLTWAQLTSAGDLQASVLNAGTNTSANLGSVTETITVNAYPAAISPPIKVVRSNGAAAVLTSNASMASQQMIRVDVILTWVSRSGIQRTQSETTVVAMRTP